MTYTHFQRMDADNPDGWEDISEDDMRFRLAGYYNDVESVIQFMMDYPGQVIRTSFAFYRFKPD